MVIRQEITQLIHHQVSGRIGRKVGFFAWGLINYSLYLHFINLWVKIYLPH